MALTPQQEENRKYLRSIGFTGEFGDNRANEYLTGYNAAKGLNTSVQSSSSPVAAAAPTIDYDTLSGKIAAPEIDYSKLTGMMAPTENRIGIAGSGQPGTLFQ